MNLFILDRDPVTAAQLNCDKHVCKIILEAAQMLGLAHYCNESQPPIIECKSHKNNHVSKWVRENIANYRWTVQHAMALCEEYTHRYKKMHAYQEKIEWFRDNEPSLPSLPLSEFRQAVAEDCYRDNVVDAYVAYYNNYKNRFAKWTNRPAPKWFGNGRK